MVLRYEFLNKKFCIKQRVNMAVRATGLVFKFLQYDFLLDEY